MLQIQWDAVEAASRYILQRSINEEDYEILSANLLSAGYTDTLPVNADTVQYAVAYQVDPVYEGRAWDDLEAYSYDWDEIEGRELTWDIITDQEEKEPEQSDYGYSDVYDVEPPLDTPRFATLPAEIYEGDTIDVSWAADMRSAASVLDVRYGSSEAFTTLYEGSQTDLQLTLPMGKTYLELRAMSYVDKDTIRSGYGYASSEVIANRAPSISGQDEDLGPKYKEFSITFTVTDPDPNEVVGVVVQLSGNEIFNNPEIDLGVQYTVEITDDMIASLAVGTMHEIIIIAVDKTGLSDRRTYTFTAVENITTRLVYRVYRDGIPIAETRSLTYDDYMAVGNHEYYIEAMDEDGTIYNSNTVVVDIRVRYATIALTGEPGDYVELKLREGQPPQTSRSISMNYEEIWLLGNRKPKHAYSDQNSNKLNVTYSIVKQDELRKLQAIASSGNPLVYRDHFNEFIIGVIDNFPYDLNRELSHPEMDIWVDTSFMITEGDYQEEIEYD